MGPFAGGIPAAEDPRASSHRNEAARRLVELRDRWLNPPEWVEWLEDARPQWLADAHTALDAAVAAAYGWDADIGEEEALEELLALNLSMSA